MEPVLMELAAEMQKAANSYIPKAYEIGRAKAQAKYGVVKPWGESDNVNVELLLTRHAAELSTSMARVEQAANAGKPLAGLIDGLLKRASAWSWTLFPAMAMGLAAYVEQNRTEIAVVEKIPASDIGIIWLTAEDERVCKKCLYLAGRWFPAKQAYEIATTIHPGCRCSRFFDVGTPDEAMVGPIPGYRAGTADDVYRDLNVEGVGNLTKEREKRARRIIARGKPVNYTRPYVNI
jgi:hypothetical protein